MSGQACHSVPTGEMQSAPIINAAILKNENSIIK